MTDPSLTPPIAETNPEINTEEILRSLRRKEGTWVKWGQACQQLQRAGHSPQVIFEETGFEPIHQNQIIVASQVYAGLVSGNASEPVLTHFEQKGSDCLYELRVLAQAERVATAELLIAKKVDAAGTHDVIRAIRELSRLKQPPEGFSSHPGDAVAYQCWKAARQKDDFQERSRVIAKGLSFAHSDTARQQIEKLLTDFTKVKLHSAPRLPIYRLEEEIDMPRILPVVGKLPLTRADLQVVPAIDAIAPFRVVKFAGEGAWVALPGWQIILQAEDPVVILANIEDLLPEAVNSEEVLVTVDRAQRDWEANSYFLTASEERLELQWFEELPALTILGRVILVMRPNRVFDEDARQEIWEMDE